MPTKLPRVNVTVTEEQHALLVELAKLNGGSAASYLRQMLDAATPLLRATVPVLRSAAEEMNASKQDAEKQIGSMLRSLREAGVNLQPDLLDDPPATAPSAGAQRSERSERGRTRRGAKS